MYSRYDKMKESLVQDPVDNTSYPDPLSINFSTTTLTELPKLRDLSQADLEKFWLCNQNFYSMSQAEGDDIVLIINNVPYLGMLKPGDQLYFPAQFDIFNLKVN